MLRQHLATLRGFELAIPAAAGNLDTSTAAVWTRNPTEILDRQRLEQSWGRRLCAFLGIPPGPGLASTASIPLIV